MNIETLKEALPYAFKADVAVMVQGHHGIGKSAAVKQFVNEMTAKEPNTPWGFIDLRLGTQEPGDLLGLADFEVDAKGNKVATKFMRPNWFPTDPNSKGIIFLDEINRARRDVLQAIFQLVLDRKIHSYELPKGWFVVAAMNPNIDGYIVTDIGDKAFMDRFCHIKLTPSFDEFRKYAKTKKFAPELQQFLTDQPKLLQEELETYDLTVTPSRRSWEFVDRLYKLNPPSHVLRELINGLVGVTASTAFFKSLNDADKPLTAEDVLFDYPKIQKKIKKYSDDKTGGRQDLLKFTNDSLLDYFKESKKPLTKEATANFVSYLKDIPKDLLFSLLHESFLINESTREAIRSDKELVDILKSVRNPEVKTLGK